MTIGHAWSGLAQWCVWNVHSAASWCLHGLGNPFELSVKKRRKMKRTKPLQVGSRLQCDAVSFDTDNSASYLL